jgi:hypothetical protein
MRSLILGALIAATPAAGHPFRDQIPTAFQGIYGRTAASCSDPEEIAFLSVTADQLAYYESDEFLLLGISFEGPAGPMFNGRFIAREETRIIGESNLQLVMETPDRLVRYQLADDAGEPAAGAPRDVWIRCPSGSLQTRQSQ